MSRATSKSFVPCLLLALAFAACDPRATDPPVAASGESRVAAVIAHPAPLAAGGPMECLCLAGESVVAVSR